ncbi:MAG: hypothetical protein HKN40_02460 [Winogradskyella sp.]|nr:hypothetical protein [Winogradskyella sp.]
MRLPHNLISEIAKNHPNWHFKDNTQLVNYDVKDGASKLFLVKIEKNGQKKTLKYKVAVTASNIDYIAMN